MVTSRGLILGIVAGTLVIQTVRLRSAVAEIAASRAEVAIVGRTVAVYEDDVLRQVRARLDSAGGWLVDAGAASAIIAVVDTKCTACQTAMTTLRSISPARTLFVMSFADGADMLRSWLNGIGAKIDILNPERVRAMLVDLPQNVTPVFLELQHGEPVGLHVGQPKQTWLTNLSDYRQ